MSAALAVRDCSLVEFFLFFRGSTWPLTRRTPNNHQQQQRMRARVVVNSSKMSFLCVTNRETDGIGLLTMTNLEELAWGSLDSTRTPMNVNLVKAAMHELESNNTYLKQQLIQKLEQVMYTKLISIVPSDHAKSDTK
eukprot:scaffold17437_cov173-Amphora_coffeaeformis.AAC.4